MSIARPGTVIYTQMLNGRGGIECDLTATRIDDDRYVLVTGTAFGNHDIGWIRKQLGNERGEAVTVRDATGSMGCFGLWGPRARDILSSVTPDDLSNEAFPYMTARQIVVGDVPCLALRVTYVGELGWELYPNVEFAGALWDTLVTAGEPFGMSPAGYRAIDSLRLEKGYRAWGADITPEEHPFEAGLGFAVRMDVPGFIGNEALEQVLARGVTRRLSCLTLADPRAMTLGNEPVFRSGEVVSRVTSGGLGYSVGASIAYAYLPIEAAVPGTAFQVEVFGERVPAVVADEPLWDPEGRTDPRVARLPQTGAVVGTTITSSATTTCTPRAVSSTRYSSSSPASVTRIDAASIGAIEKSATTPTLELSATITTCPRVCSIMTRATSASAIAGVVSPDRRLNPSTPMNERVAKIPRSVRVASSPTHEFEATRYSPPTSTSSALRSPASMAAPTWFVTTRTFGPRWRTTSSVVVPPLRKTVSPSAARRAAAAAIRCFSTG